MMDRSGQAGLEEALVYRVAAHGRHVWLSVVYAVLGTCGVFILLPFSEMLDKPDVGRLEIRTVDQAPMKQPPPEVKDLVPPSPPRARKETERRAAKPKIQLPRTANRKRPKLPVLLDTGTMELAGDFALNFALVPRMFDSEVESDLDDMVFELDEVDQQPRPILRGRPIYPYRAIRRNMEGHVRVQFIVNTEGRVEDIEVVESEPGEIFVEAARQAVENWRFEPAVKDGRPVSVWMVTTLHFQLEG